MKIPRTGQDFPISLTRYRLSSGVFCFSKVGDVNFRSSRARDLHRTASSVLSNFASNSLPSRSCCSDERENNVDSSRAFSFSRFVRSVTAFGNDLSGVGERVPSFISPGIPRVCRATRQHVPRRKKGRKKRLEKTATQRFDVSLLRDPEFRCTSSSCMLLR